MGDYCFRSCVYFCCSSSVEKTKNNLCFYLCSDILSASRTPSVDEIAKGVGISKGTAHNYLKELKSALCQIIWPINTCALSEFKRRIYLRIIGNKENVKDIVIPSEERQMKMYPLDFEEFCWALGEKPLIPYIRSCFEKKQPLERSLHDKAMLLFKQYMLVGGMPKAVATFLEARKDFGKADMEKRDILNLYRNDIMKIKAQYRAKVLAIFDQIPGLLSQHEKRVVFNRVVEGSMADQYEETFFWLSDSMIANECRKCDDPNVGLSLNESDAYIKCYLGDTGLLVSHAFDENELLENEVYKQILSGKLSLNEGMLYENVIAQMLVANGHRLFFYTHYSEEKHRNDIEIDFIISNNSKTRYKMYPIEVKSGKTYSLKSLIRFKEKYKQRIGGVYVIHPKNLIEKDDILCIPPYMTMCL